MSQYLQHMEKLKNAERSALRSSDPLLRLMGITLCQQIEERLSKDRATDEDVAQLGVMASLEL